MIRVAIVEDEVHSVSTSRFREILHLRAGKSGLSGTVVFYCMGSHLPDL